MHTQYLSDGADLAQWGYLLTTDGAWGSPPVRGANLAMPHRPGQVWEQKVADQAVLNLIFGVLDQIPGGGTVTDPVAQHLANMQAFRAALWKTTATRTLTRNLTLPSGVQTTTGAFELASLQSQRLGVSARQVTVALTLLDGYLYGATVDKTVTGSQTISVLGDASTVKMTIDLPGAGTLTNSTLGISVTVSALTTLDVLAFTSTAGIGLVTAHTGDDFWMRLQPGNNAMVWSGSGAATLHVNEAYL